MDEYFPQVVQAVPGENYNVYAYFTDGNIKRYNAKWMIDKGLLNDKSLREALTVLNGTVAWDLSGKYDSSDCIDIDPFTVYEGESVNESDFWAA